MRARSPRLLPLKILLLPIFFWLSTSLPAHAQELQTEIVYSTRVNELAPIITGMAAPEGGATAYRDQLIIRATPEKMPLLLEHLKQLDRPLKNLRVTVRRQLTQASSSRALDADGNVRLENGNVSGNVDITARENQNRRSSNDEYSITASEGSAVMIHTGSDIPYLTVINSNTQMTALGQQYVPVQSGMQVTPRLQPDGRVMLDISFQQAAPGHSGNIRREGTQTQLQTRLGEWTTLSGIEHSVSMQGSGIASQYRRESKSSRPLEIRVEELP